MYFIEDIDQSAQQLEESGFILEQRKLEPNKSNNFDCQNGKTNQLNPT